MSYLIVIISPGFAWIYQLQFNLAGYSRGQPGLVIIPLGPLICSGISPQPEKICRVDVTSHRAFCYLSLSERTFGAEPNNGPSI